MKLIFNLDYQTIFGEEIVLHIDDSKLDLRGELSWSERTPH